jgi:hypothetical protein
VAVALVDPAGPPGRPRKLQPVERTVAKMPLVDPHPDDAFTLPMGRRLIEVARAAGIAVAVLVPSALDGPSFGHVASPCRLSRCAGSYCEDQAAAPAGASHEPQLS